MAEAERPANARELFLLLLAAFALLAPGISSLPPVDRDEPRYAVATTQMLQSGDFVDIRYQAQPRYLQPAGVYWLQAIPTALFSAPGGRSIWTYRLASLLGAVFAAVATAWAASRVFGRRVGLSAGVFLASCLSLGFEARIAKTDAALLAAVVVAQFALMRAYLAPSPPRWTTAAFWAALGCGVLLKGPIILLVVGLTLAALALWDRRAAWLGRLRPLWGAPLMLLVAAPWYVAIGVQSHGGFFRTAIGRSLMGKVAAGQQAHGAPFGYHLLAFPLTFWPASLLAVMAAPFAWRERGRPEVRFLLCWIVPAWIAFEAVKTKLPHYVLPLFPAIACLAALALFSPKVAASAWKRGAFALFLALWTALSLALVTVGPVALWRYAHRLDPLAMALAAGGAVCVGALLWSLWKGRRRAVVAAVAGAALFTATDAYVAALPRLDAFWLSPRVAQAARAAQAARRCPAGRLISTPFHEPSLVFLYGPDRTVLAETPAEAADDLAVDRACGLALVGEAQRPAFVARAAAAGLGLRPLQVLRGRDYSDNRDLALTLYAADPAVPANAPGNAPSYAPGNTPGRATRAVATAEGNR